MEIRIPRQSPVSRYVLGLAYILTIITLVQGHTSGTFSRTQPTLSLDRLTGREWYNHASVSSKNDFVASIILQLVFVRFYIYRIFKCTLMWMFLVLAVDVTA